MRLDKLLSVAANHSTVYCILFAMLGVAATRAASAANAIESASKPPLGFTNRTMLVHVVDSQTGKPVAGVKVINSTTYVSSQSNKPVEPVTDAKGDVTLQLWIPPAEARRQLSDFSLNTDHRDYAPRVVQWHSDGGGVLDDVQPEYTVKLLKGIALGGVVKDDKGNPLAGAQIVLNAYGSTGFPMGTGEKRVVEYSQYFTPPYLPGVTNDRPPTLSGKDGKWTVNNFPSDLDAVQLTVVRDDGSDAVYVTNPERFGVSRSTKLIAFDELRAKTFVTTLSTGITVRGRILNAEGKPIKGAKITEAYGMGNPQPRGVATTDASGGLEFRNRRARQAIWTVDAPGYALTCEVVTIKTNMPETLVRLQPAKPAVVRVVTEDGKPVPEARLEVQSWRNEAMYLTWGATSDTNGLITWSNAPFVPVRAWVAAPNKPAGYVTLQAGKTEKVTIRSAAAKEIKLTISAVNATDKKPISDFEVQIDKHQWQRFSPMTTSTNGIAVASLRQEDFQSGNYPTFVIRAVAKGFLPSDSSSIDFNEGDQKLELALETDRPIHGVVKKSDGTPAAGAFVLVSRDRSQVSLNQEFQRGQVKPPSWGSFTKVTTDDAGKYELEGAPHGMTVVVLHEEGYAEVPADDLRSKGDIALKTWGVVEGTLKIGDQIAPAGQRVGLFSRSYSSGGLYILFDGTTDAEGHFAIERVPAGSYKLFRYVGKGMGTIIESHRQDIDVAAGQTLKVDMGGRGTRIEGRLNASRYTDLDWTLNKQIMTARTVGNIGQTDGPAWEDFVRRTDFEAANQKPRIFPSPKQYVLTVDKDGTFFVDDVEPGEYQIAIKVTEPPTRQYMEDGKLIGSLSTNITVPDLSQAKSRIAQLGPFTLPVSGAASSEIVTPLKVSLLPPPSASMADRGKPIELAGKSPNGQLILFWAPWSEQSRKALQEFQTTISTAKTQSKMNMLAVALEDDQTEIRTAANTAGWKGTIGQLSGIDFVKAYATHGLNELPLLLGVDPEGRVIVKSRNTARLRDLIDNSANDESAKK